jgi:hypothetical protein
MEMVRQRHWATSLFRASSASELHVATCQTPLATQTLQTHTIPYHRVRIAACTFSAFVQMYPLTGGRSHDAFTGLMVASGALQSYRPPSRLPQIPYRDRLTLGMHKHRQQPPPTRLRSSCLLPPAGLTESAPSTPSVTGIMLRGSPATSRTSFATQWQSIPRMR